MGNRDKKKKKQKRREARLRQEKHERKAQPRVDDVGGELYEPALPRKVEPIRFDHAMDDPLDEDGEEFEPGGGPDDDWAPDLDEMWGGSLCEEGYWGETDDPDDDAFCLPDNYRFPTERALRHVAKLGDGSRRDDWIAAVDFLGKWCDQDETPLPADLVERAQELAYRAMETTDIMKIGRLAREALTFDPDCVDALSQLAFVNHAAPDGRTRELERAVATGERALGGPAFFEAHKGRFFAMVETRPYMRAREYLANVLAESGRIPEAIAHYEALMELDPVDHQNLRTLLLCRYLETGRLDDAKRIMERFPYGRPIYLWTCVLGYFLTGNRARASQLYIRAIEDDDGLDELFIEDDEAPPHALSPSLPFEKPFVLVPAYRAAWRKHPEAIEWIRNAAKAYTDEEIRRCRESFSPPVSKLFELGEPKEETWRNYRKTFDLADEHIPELIRVLETFAFEESEGRDGFAHLHAWRALAQLKAQQAIAPVLKRFRDDADQFVHEDFTKVFTLFGPASIPGLRDLMAGPYVLSLRGVAARTLFEMGSRDRDAAPQCVEMLMEQLRGYRRNPRPLNTDLITALRKLKVFQAQTLIDEVESAGARIEMADFMGEY